MAMSESVSLRICFITIRPHESPKVIEKYFGQEICTRQMRLRWWKYFRNEEKELKLEFKEFI